VSSRSIDGFGSITSARELVLRNKSIEARSRLNYDLRVPATPTHQLPTIGDSVMSLTCSYCGSSLETGSSKCEGCGAPVSPDSESSPDFRSCPYCRRRLLALASPSCSYCGRRLPEDYIKAREADLKRIAEFNSNDSGASVTHRVGELIRHAQDSGGQESLLDILNLTDLLS